MQIAKGSTREEKMGFSPRWPDEDFLFQWAQMRGVGFGESKPGEEKKEFSMHAFGAQFAEVRVVAVPQNQGYGYGIQQGLLQASGEIVGYMDGDGQILPEDMLHVLGRMKTDRAAKAVRVWRGDGGLRQVVSWCYNRVFKILFRIPQRDVNAKPKFMHRSDFLRIAPISKDWFIDPEVMIKAAALGVVWVEVPVEFRRRSRGQSSVRVQTALEFFRNLIRWRFGGQLPAWRTKLG